MIQIFRNFFSEKNVTLKILEFSKFFFGKKFNFKNIQVFRIFFLKKKCNSGNFEISSSLTHIRDFQKF